MLASVFVPDLPAARAEPTPEYLGELCPACDEIMINIGAWGPEIDWHELGRCVCGGARRRVK
jgi:hypothetical protein